MSANPNGPFVTAAILCEGLQEVEPGVVSIHRIINHVTFPLGPDDPADMPSEASPIRFSPIFQFSFTTNKEDGKHHLRFVLEGPRQEDVVLLDGPAVVEVGEIGLTYNCKVDLWIKSTGRHWVRVELDGELLTKTPLHVFVQRTHG